MKLSPKSFRFCCYCCCSRVHPVASICDCDFFFCVNVNRIYLNTYAHSTHTHTECGEPIRVNAATHKMMSRHETKKNKLKIANSEWRGPWPMPKGNVRITLWMGLRGRVWTSISAGKFSWFSHFPIPFVRFFLVVNIRTVALSFRSRFFKWLSPIAAKQMQWHFGFARDCCSSRCAHHNMVNCLDCFIRTYESLRICLIAISHPSRRTDDVSSGGTRSLVCRDKNVETFIWIRPFSQQTQKSNAFGRVVLYQQWQLLSRKGRERQKNMGNIRTNYRVKSPKPHIHTNNTYAQPIAHRTNGNFGLSTDRRSRPISVFWL